jgi:ABC-2 type transport system ATP-binding protein
MMLHQLHHDGLTIVVSTPYMDEAEYASRLGFLHNGRVLDVGTRAEVIARYGRALVEVQSIDRIQVRGRLSAMPDVDDVSLFGTVLHVRGRAGVAEERLRAAVRAALDGRVADDAVRVIAPSLEDVFVLHGDAAEGAVAA